MKLPSCNEAREKVGAHERQYVELLTLTRFWVAEWTETSIQIGTLVVIMWRILCLVTTSMCGNRDFLHITCMRCWDCGFSRLAVTPLPLSVSRNMQFLTRSRVTADTGLPGDFLGTSWGLHRFLLASPVIEYVPKKYKRKVKPEAIYPALAHRITRRNKQIWFLPGVDLCVCMCVCGLQMHCHNASMHSCSNNGVFWKPRTPLLPPKSVILVPN